VDGRCKKTISKRDQLIMDNDIGEKNTREIENGNA
jgi:hypothetical protein